jgi:hypothetical protein
MAAAPQLGSSQAVAWVVTAAHKHKAKKHFVGCVRMADLLESIASFAAGKYMRCCKQVYSRPRPK